MKDFKMAVLLLALALAAACATAPPVDLSEPTRLLGQESGVRLNAQMFMQGNAQRAPIAIADIVPETTFDSEEQTLTISLGSEVPGNEYLPKLTVVGPGEKKSFTAKGKVDSGVIATSTSLPRYIRIKLNFLGQVAPFAQLVNIPEKAIHDPKLADELFPKWVEANETVITNAVPVYFPSRNRFDDPASSSRP